MVALYSSAMRLSFFKFLSVPQRRGMAIGLVSGSSGLSSFQGTATRYLPFSYWRESFTLLKASLSSLVSTSLSAWSVPDFLISQNLLRLLSTSQQDPFLSFPCEQGTDNVLSCSHRIVFFGRTNTAPTEWSEPGDRSTIFPSKINTSGVQSYQFQSKDRQLHHLLAWQNCTGSGEAICSDTRSSSQLCNRPFQLVHFVFPFQTT